MKPNKQLVKKCNDYCDKAEHILQEQENTTPIPAMAREIITCAKEMMDSVDTLPEAYHALRRIADCIDEHPRLLLQLKLTELETVKRAEAIEKEEFSVKKPLLEEIEQLKANIQAADEGRFSDIKTGRMLKSDPIEWTTEYENVIDDVNKEVYANLKNTPRGMGFCFGYWAEKRTALAKRGIEWKSPNIMNPRVLFD